MTDTPNPPQQAELAALRRRLDRLRSSDDLAPDVLLQDLETAYEELRTSEEELRVQQEQISRLVSDQASDRRQQERMLGMLPVAVLTTDRQGVVRVANAAAAGLLRVPMGRLVGKPLFALVSSECRADLRRHLSDATEQPARQLATFVRRDGSAVTVDVLLAPGPSPWAEVRWVLLAADPGDAEQEERRRLTSGLMRLAGIVGSVEDVHDLVVAASAIVRDGIHDAASVSIAVASPLDPVAVGTTEGLAQHIDGAQIAAGEGPAVTAFATDGTVVSDDLVRDARWPALARHLPEGTGAAVAAPMASDAGDVAGVLAVYLPPGHGIGPAVKAAALYAATVAALVAEVEAKKRLADLAADLRRAMQSRAVIEQAKGIIMAQRHCDDEEAFAHLVRISSTSHVKLRDVAREVVELAIGTSQADA